MLFCLFYTKLMIAQSHWNLYYGPLILGMGIFLQTLFICKPHLPFIIACLGALCITFLCYVDRDITLFIGQVGILFFQFLLRRKK